MVNFPDPRPQVDIVTSVQDYCAWGFAVLLPFLELERLNHPALLIVTAVKFWHALGGLYM
jgi:hypothetical protein